MTDEKRRHDPENEVLPAEERTLDERQKQTLPMRRVYVIVLMAILFVIVVAVVAG